MMKHLTLVPDQTSQMGWCVPCQRLEPVTEGSSRRKACTNSIYVDHGGRGEIVDPDKGATYTFMARGSC